MCVSESDCKNEVVENKTVSSCVLSVNVRDKVNLGRSFRIKIPCTVIILV